MTAMKNLNFPGLPRILVVDDEEAIREGLRSLLQGESVAVESADGLEAALARIEQRSFDVVLFDVHLQGSGGLEVVSRLRRRASPPDVILLAGYGTQANTVEAMRTGAFDVIEKPIHRDRVMATIRRCLEMRQASRELTWAQERLRDATSTELLGLSPSIRALEQRIEEVAQSPDTTVLIAGERGAGKELVARRIHESSVRRHGPFVIVNCAAQTENLLESELFGHEAGAFTNAGREGKDGLFALAAGGTLFLDEIGEMGKALQAKLLRVLQERTFRRVGGVRDIAADVRIVVASTKDLRKEAESGRFREDLFFRLNVMTVEVPALRSRAQDVPLLAHFFLDQYARHLGKNLTGFTEEATETLCEYEWPGNVRELRNVIERAAIACAGGMIDECHLPAFSGGPLDGSDEIARNLIVLDGNDCSIRSLENQLVRKILEATNWNISRAAAMLGINRTTLYNKIRVYEIGQRPGREAVEVS
ncbi:MAG: sigma-54-dependent Fis family transcriptional regulator [Planctomycetes bacterium]|nr:sigma-54-dependent Fis family transcriptional regulator [Planctomycetota bacterium]